MPLAVTDLKPGDRVMLNCPAARGAQKREAQFQAVFASYADAMNDGSITSAILVQRNTVAFSRTTGPWARFLLQTIAPGSETTLRTPGGDALPFSSPANIEKRLMAVFAVEPDGSLREEEGRRITIERRMTMGQG